ncbi:MAG: class I SAM-dependent methyltransferase [Erysipelotrichaceae bacterium]|nr:class I SAM-dependent methyltransferase [Erysipelotrichaceae bacterium]
MRPTNINNIAHQWILDKIPIKETAIDATIGNGNDTYFLAKHFQKVYGFDIQDQALINTNRMVKDLNNVILIKDSHQFMSDHIKEKVDLIIFNLGYLPNGDPSITTQAPSTIAAIKDACSLLKTHASLMITFYIGHAQGAIEHETFKISLSNFNELQVLDSYTYHDRHLAPILYHLKKNKKKDV